MRTILRTKVSVGLFGVEGRLYKAKDDDSGFEFHWHHGWDCRGAVGTTRICKECHKPVEYADIVSGAVVGDTLVLVSDDEKKAMHDTAAGKELGVIQFADQAEVDPIYFSGDAYLFEPEPNPKTVEAHHVLRQAMLNRNVVAVVKFTRAGCDRLALLRVSDAGVFVVHMIEWPDQVRDAGQLKHVHDDMPVKAGDLALADTLIDTYLGTFNPADPPAELKAAFVDTYTANMRELVAAKAIDPTKQFVAPEGEEAEDISDLQAALEASIKAKAASKAAPAGRKRGNAAAKTAPRKAAARKAA